MSDKNLDHMRKTGAQELLDENRKLRAENARLRAYRIHLMRVADYAIRNEDVYRANMPLFDDIISLLKGGAE